MTHTRHRPQLTVNWPAFSRLAWALVGVLAATACPAVNAQVNTSSCESTHPEQTKQNLRTTCEPDRSGAVHPCGVYSPIRSNLCRARQMKGDVYVHFEHFGMNDCRASKHSRSLKEITKVVIHQGGWDAENNMKTWGCRPAASHYSIQRDGKVFQHMGEELIAPHAKGVNAHAIGIELNLPREAGQSCNSLDLPKKLPADAKQARVRAACTPSPEQYAALNGLLAAIAKRTSVTLDAQHVVGHCESEHAGGHGDPRAFDWSRIGISNAEKDRMATGTACEWYGLYKGGM